MLHYAYVRDEVGGAAGQMVCVYCEITLLIGKKVEFGFHLLGQLPWRPSRACVWEMLLQQDNVP